MGSAAPKFKNSFLLAAALLLCLPAIVLCHEISNQEPDVDHIPLHQLAKRQVESGIVVERRKCADDSENCRQWARQDYCRHPDYQRFMSIKCRKTCGFCREEKEPTACRDERDACSYWKAAGYCEKESYKAFMASRCRRSCRLCPDQIGSESSESTKASDKVVTTPEPSEESYTTVTQFTAWSEWSECSRTCGGGSMERKRKCVYRKCRSIQAQSCATDPCPATTTTVSTTAEPTTTEPSTIKATSTEAATTEITTTEEMTTKSTTAEPSTVEPATTEPATTEPATTEPATTESATTEPATTEPSTTEPSTTVPSTSEPSTTEPSTSEPATTGPATTEPVTTKPASTEPVTTELTTDISVVAVTNETVAEEQTTVEHISESPITTSEEVTSTQSSSETTIVAESTESVTAPDETSTTINTSMSTVASELVTTGESATDESVYNTTSQATRSNLQSSTAVTFSSAETGKAEDCIDISRSCYLLSFICKTSVYAQENCKASCGLCNITTTQTTSTSQANTIVSTQSFSTTSEAAISSTEDIGTLMSSIIPTSTTAESVSNQTDPFAINNVTTASTNDVTLNGTSSSTVEPTTAAESCVDRMSTCAYFAARGCTSNIMKMFCRRACGFCQPAATTPEVPATTTISETATSPALSTTDTTEAKTEATTTMTTTKPLTTESSSTASPTSNPDLVTSESISSTSNKYPSTTYPTTTYPTTRYPTTKYPTTQYPTTKYPTTKYPITKYPTTQYPTTKYPTTKYPTTTYPTTNYPTTKYPTTTYPTTTFPTTSSGSTLAASTFRTTVMATSSFDVTSVLMTTPAPQTTEADCVDQYVECASISIYCNVNVNVTRNCPATCGVCTPEGTSPVTPRTTQMPSTASLPAKKCEDTFPNCAPLIPQCRNREAMLYLSVTCQKSCGFCTEETTTIAAASSTPTQLPVIENCEDSNEKCLEWADYGLCNSTIYPEMMTYMQSSCRKACDICEKSQWSEWSDCSVSCGGGQQERTIQCFEDDCSEAKTERRACNFEVCPETNKCSDRMATRACEQYKRRNACQTTLVQALCAKTCELCKDDSVTSSNTTSPTDVTNSTTTESCADKHELCGNWSKRGFCENTYTTYMKQNCRNSCGLCSVWARWSTWSPCNQTCGGGVMTRNRTCETEGCRGATEDSTSCNDFKCPTCFDQNQGCALVAQTGKCNEMIWKLLCKRSCQVCQPEPITGPCHDTSLECPGLMEAGRCENLQVVNACPKSCGKCPGFEKETEPGKCVDTNVNCPTAASLGRCTDPRVKSLCPLSCEVCTPTAPVTSIVPTLPPGVTGCIDRLELCKELASSCSNNSMVKDQCPKTCGICKDSCVDKNSLCPKLAEAGQCSLQIVSDECPESCRSCSVQPKVEVIDDQCADKLDSCPKLVEMLNCTNPLVLESCAETCGRCKVEVPEEKKECVDQHSQCPAYAQQGKCQQIFYAFLCVKSCRECDKQQVPTAKPICADNYPETTCQLLKSRCSLGLVGMQCSKTCGVCKERDDKDAVCVDQNAASCKTLASYGMCKQSAFKEMCKATCGACEEATATTVVEKVSPVETCQDERGDCLRFYNDGNCNLAVIQSVCRRSCGVCSYKNPQAVRDPDAPCLDSSPQCAFFAQMKQCRATKTVQVMCAKSCDYCPKIIPKKANVPSPTCRDRSTSMCQRMKQYCLFGNVGSACPLTCGKCKTTDQEGMSGGSNVFDPNRPTGFQKCKDHMEECPDYGALCSQTYINTMCPKTCSSCGATAATTARPITTTQVTTTPTTTAQQNASPDTEAYTAWGMWSKCSKSCGKGWHIRNRTCTSGGCSESLEEGGFCNKDPCEGRSQEVTGCQNLSPLCSRWLEAAPGRCRDVRYRDQMRIQCRYACGHCKPELVWGSWSECSAQCGGGSRERTKRCEIDGACGNQTSIEENEACNTEACGVWSSWKSWAPCSATCGEGVRSRERFCPSQGSDNCQGSSVEQEACITNVTCPGWSNWSTWSNCSASCGNGTATRSRVCNPGNENVTCSGNTTEELVCNDGPCAEWSGWGEWSSCSASCGSGGVEQRSRRCSYGDGCPGNGSETRECESKDSCIRWSEWSEFTECSASCGGVSTRRRACIGGEEDTEECPGSSEESIPCNWDACLSASHWSEWGEYDSCPVTCGGGKTMRRRFCLNGLPGVGGCPGNATEVGECAIEECPVGYWSEWTEWTPCSSSCGSGVRSRERDCIEGLPGVSGCPGLREVVERCNRQSCPSWSSWQPWSACSASCGKNGERMRIQECIDPNIDEVVSDSLCASSKNTFQKQQCNFRPCPTWAAWGSWGRCSASCGVGRRQRNRPCANGSVGDRGCKTGGDVTQQLCNPWDCPRACETTPIVLDSNAASLSNAITSSSHAFGHAPRWALLGSSRAWCPTNQDRDQWLQIDLASPASIAGISVAGFVNEDGMDQVYDYSWVSKYAVYYANDTTTDGSAEGFKPLFNNVGERRGFKGPEGPLHQRQRFWEPTVARFWRIQVLASYPVDQGCMQVQLHTCLESETGSGSFT